jgi:HAD superfamily hydrolase (TIGR01662 family)
MIRAVIFDVGGPLDLEFEFEAAIDADIREGLRREGMAVDEDTWAAAHRYAVETCAPSLYRSLIWRLTAGDQDASLRAYEWMQGRADLREFFELRPGIPDVLQSLKESGLKLGLAANQPLRALRSLEEAGIGHFFANPGISAVYGFRKPDVRLFLRACEDLDVEPARCILVGDRIDNDIVPAKLLGMRTVLIRTGRHREQQARSWDEVPDAEVEDAAGILRAVTSILDEAS